MNSINKYKLNTVIVDYGSGNLYSVQRALYYLGASPEITDNAEKILKADRLILPGVGAFGDGMLGLKKKRLIEPIKKYAESGKPLLGICLGMQLFMTEGEEFGCYEGLDIIKGKAIYLKSIAKGEFSEKLPHIGWNKILLSQASKTLWKTTILEDLHEGSFLYFVHSNIVVTHDPLACLAETVYGDVTFSSVIRKGNIYGCQFHPERSGETGLEIYKNFISEKND